MNKQQVEYETVRRDSFDDKINPLCTVHFKYQFYLFIGPTKITVKFDNSIHFIQNKLISKDISLLNKWPYILFIL